MIRGAAARAGAAFRFRKFEKESGAIRAGLGNRRTLNLRKHLRGWGLGFGRGHGRLEEQASAAPQAARGSPRDRRDQTSPPPPGPCAAAVHETGPCPPRDATCLIPGGNVPAVQPRPAKIAQAELAIASAKEAPAGRTRFAKKRTVRDTPGRLRRRRILMKGPPPASAHPPSPETGGFPAVHAGYRPGRDPTPPRPRPQPVAPSATRRRSSGRPARAQIASTWRAESRMKASAPSKP